MILTGVQLGRYTLNEWIGSGGMGDVYLAEDPHSGENVAIKVVKAELALNANEGAEHLMQDFQKEARAIASLDHPGILKVLAYGEERLNKNMFAYLVMPYCPEGNLLQWLQKRGREQLPLEARGKLIEQAANALQYAHDHQVVHRDVKPANFLIEEKPGKPDEPDLLLSDFGIAKLMDATSSTSQTMRGTPAYMAPEQWGGAATAASDQYALAVMAYEMLAGHLPFQGNPMQMLQFHLHALPQAPSSLNPALPQGVDAVLLCALRKKPGQRYPSMIAFAHNLLKALDQQEYTVTPVQEESDEHIDMAGIVNTNAVPAGSRGTGLMAGLLLFLLLGSFILVLTRINPAGAFTGGQAEPTSGIAMQDASPTASAAVAFPSAPTPAQSNSNGNTGATPALVPTPVPSPIPTPAPTLAPTPVLIPTPTPTPTPIPTPTSTPTPVPTFEPTPTPVPVSAPTILGGVPNLDGYCRSIGDTRASLDGNTGYSWMCVTPSGQHNGFSFTAACRWQYNDPQAEDQLVNYYDPNSWQCFTNASLVGNTTNLDGYCRSLGDTRVSLDGNTAYDWKCVTPSGDHAGIDITAACVWQYHVPHVITRMADYNNPNSWQCWA